ncbi:MAG: hypothetical protein LBV13_01255 [Methanomassiliicoccaceae archaeon]|jgi:hypothetical protein|nr:hypothetical protein [Methanomassiliicoccaceae archaeon]
MVAMNFTFGPAEWLIPANLKLSTIRARNLKKEEQIVRSGKLQLYWKQRTPDCRLLGFRDLKKLTVIEMPLREFIRTAEPNIVYMEGFGHSWRDMMQFFEQNYGMHIDIPGAFYMVEWWPAARGASP